MYPRIGSDWDFDKNHINEKQTFFHQNRSRIGRCYARGIFYRKTIKIDENNALYSPPLCVGLLDF